MTLSQQILSRVLSLIPVVLSLSVHEWAHAWAASRLGDTTAKDQGRLTLNPLAHIDAVGTLALPLLGIPFGWAKPVPVEPTRFRADVPMTYGLLLTAAAGPFSNLVLATGCVALLLGGHRFHAFPRGDLVIESLLERGVLINVALGLFNLLPIPPLDGSRIVDGLIPFEHRARFRAAGPFLLILLALPLFWIGSTWIASATGSLTAMLRR
jgi:Zn-dependent protease